MYYYPYLILFCLVTYLDYDKFMFKTHSMISHIYKDDQQSAAGVQVQTEALILSIARES